MLKIEFRPSLPEDVDEAVPLIFASGPSTFNYVFTNEKLTAIDFLKHAFPRKGGEFSFDNHYTLLLDKNIIGIGSAFSGKRASGFMFKEILNIIRFYKFSAIPIMIRGLKVEGIIKPPKKNEIAIAHIAIDEKVRSRGHGEKLINFLMTEVQKASSSSFVLDVSEENPRAQQLYERMGFKVVKHILSRYKTNHGYVPNFYRMELK